MGYELSAMQEKYIKINNLQVSEKLSNFVNDELLKNTNVSSENFWLGLEKTLDELASSSRVFSRPNQKFSEDTFVFFNNSSFTKFDSFSDT